MPNPPNICVRLEEPTDTAATEAIALAAFAPDPSVAELVRKLRTSEALIPELNLVAEVDGVVAGHIMFTRAPMTSGHTLALLSPLGVLPSHQRLGLGSALVRRALEWLEQSEFPAVVIEGVPSYYPRFGFASARAMGIEPPYDVPDAAWQGLRLPRYREDVQGTVAYAPEFDFLTPH